MDNKKVDYTELDYTNLRAIKSFLKNRALSDKTILEAIKKFAEIETNSNRSLISLLYFFHEDNMIIDAVYEIEKIRNIGEDFYSDLILFCGIFKTKMTEIAYKIGKGKKCGIQFFVNAMMGAKSEKLRKKIFDDTIEAELAKNNFHTVVKCQDLIDPDKHLAYANNIPYSIELNQEPFFMISLMASVYNLYQESFAKDEIIKKAMEMHIKYEYFFVFALENTNDQKLKEKIILYAKENIENLRNIFEILIEDSKNYLPENKNFIDFVVKNIPAALLKNNNFLLKITNCLAPKNSDDLLRFVISKASEAGMNSDDFFIKIAENCGYLPNLTKIVANQMLKNGSRNKKLFMTLINKVRNKVTKQEICENTIKFGMATIEMFEGYITYFDEKYAKKMFDKALELNAVNKKILNYPLQYRWDEIYIKKSYLKAMEVGIYDNFASYIQNINNEEFKKEIYRKAISVGASSEKLFTTALNCIKDEKFKQEILIDRYETFNQSEKEEYIEHSFLNVMQEFADQDFKEKIYNDAIKFGMEKQNFLLQLLGKVEDQELKKRMCSDAIKLGMNDIDFLLQSFVDINDQEFKKEIYKKVISINKCETAKFKEFALLVLKHIDDDGYKQNILQRLLEIEIINSEIKLKNGVMEGYSYFSQEMRGKILEKTLHNIASDENSLRVAIRNNSNNKEMLIRICEKALEVGTRTINLFNAIFRSFDDERAKKIYSETIDTKDFYVYNIQIPFVRNWEDDYKRKSYYKFVEKRCSFCSAEISSFINMAIEKIDSQELKKEIYDHFQTLGLNDSRLYLTFLKEIQNQSTKQEIYKRMMDLKIDNENTLKVAFKYIENEDFKRKIFAESAKNFGWSNTEQVLIKKELNLRSNQQNMGIQ